jgi:hypothetical protein
VERENRRIEGWSSSSRSPRGQLENRKREVEALLLAVGEFGLREGLPSTSPGERALRARGVLSTALMSVGFFSTTSVHPAGKPTPFRGG